MELDPDQPLGVRDLYRNVRNLAVCAEEHHE
jgi:hypothetical protein